MFKQVLVIAALCSFFGTMVHADSTQGSQTSVVNNTAAHQKCNMWKGHSKWTHKKFSHFAADHHKRPLHPHAVLFVDATTAISAEEQTGSRDKPFADIQQALQKVTERKSRQQRSVKIIVKNISAASSDANDVYTVVCKVRKHTFAKEHATENLQ